MKLFETTLKIFAILGVEWDESSKKYVYTKNLFICPFVCFLSSMGTFLFLIYNAQSLYEYTLVFIVLSSVTMGIVILVIFILELDKFNIYLETCEHMLHEGE